MFFRRSPSPRNGFAAVPAWGESEGRQVVFVGTERGMEAKLVPQAGFPLELIRVGGPERHRRRETAAQCGDASRRAVGLRKNSSPPPLQCGVRRRRLCLGSDDAAGGDAPNSHGGFRAERRAGFHQPRACRAWPRASPWRMQETAGRLGARAVVTGCPVRPEFFAIPPKEHRAPFTLLITGGSRGALPINRAVVDSLDRLVASEKISFSSCIRPENVTIMRFE